MTSLGVDKQKVVVTEAEIREVLHLDDAEGVDCLPNEEIFAELARMGYKKPSTKLAFYKAFFSSQWKFLIHTILQCMNAKRTSWNEFSSSMASVVICLSTCRKFNFSKYIFDGLRAGKGFSGVETLLFEGMLVEQEIEGEGDADEHVEEATAGDDAHGEVPTVTHAPSIPSPTPPTTPPQPLQDLPSTSQRVDTSDDTVMDNESNQGRMMDEMDQDDAVVLMDDKKEDKKVKEAKVVESAQVQGRQAEFQAKIYQIDMDHASEVLSMQEDKNEPTEVQEVVDVVATAKLITKVVTAASETVTAASAIIPTAEPQVPTATLTAAPTRVAAAPCRRKKGVVNRDPEEESTTSTIIPAETKSKDKGKGILIEEPKPLKKKQQIEMDEQYARKLHAELNKDIDWDVAINHLDYFKGMSYDDIRPIFEAKFNSNVDFLLKTKEHMEEEENGALQTINETPTEKAAKRRKLNEEVEDLKRHLDIVPDEDDDVYTEASPLSRKLILLVERRYPLSRFTLDQMLNVVRLQVEEESEVSLKGSPPVARKEPSRSIYTLEDLVSKFINELFPPSRTTHLRNEISNFQQRFDESFHEAWDRYKDLLRACPHHGFTELHQLDTFYNALNPTDQDSLNAVRNSRNKSVVSQVKSYDANSNSSSEIARLTNAVNQQTSAVTTVMTAILKQFQATPPPASVKAVEETYVTCGATVNYNQGNSIYRPPGMANQIRPSGFAQPNVQNNQNRFGQPQGFNRGNNFNPKQSYQATTQQNQVIHLNELEKVKRMNDANMKAMQTQINIVKNELRNEMKNSIQASLSNQTNEIKNMMASLFKMNSASTSGSGSLPSNTVANPKGELKAITTRSGHVLDGPTVPTPLPFINSKEDECVEETLTDLDLSEYTIKVPPPPVKKYKPPSQREYVVHQRDPLHLNILYPSRMLKQKQQEKDEVQIHKFWQMFKQLHINITLADALILMPKYQKMLKALLSNKEKLQELANTPFNENCSAVILKKLSKKLGDPGKFLIPCGFSELKCKALADLGASINMMPLFVWKKLADFVIVDYESYPRVPLILGRPFLWIARTLIDVHGEEMILRDGDERLTLNMRHDTSSYSNQPQKESINLINVFNDSSKDFLEDLFLNQPSGNPTFLSHPELTSPEVQHDIFDLERGNVLPEKLLDLDSTKDLHPPLHVDPLSGSTTYSYSPNPLLEELADELALITFPLKYDDDLQFDMESDLKEIEFLLHQDIDSSLKDSIDQNVESDTENVYDDPFDSKGEKIKKSKLLINELDLPCDFFLLSILIQEKPFEIITRVVQDKKLATSNASLMLEDFDPPFYEHLFFKEVPRSKMLLPFSSENEEKVFKPGIHTSEKVHSSRIPELSHQDYKVFKINQIFKISMKIFLFSCGKDTHILAVPCLYFYPFDAFMYGGIRSS
nr:hypothetical protein [Tanacetum cinerariifolium]